MKMLLTGDWHLDACTAGMSRADDLEAALKKVVKLAIDNDVDYFMFLGDLANPDAGSILIRVLDIALNAAGSLGDKGIESCWMSGNHCIIKDGGEFTSVTPLRHMPKAHVITRPLLTGRPAFGCEIMFLPYCAKPYDPEKFMQANPFTAKTRIVLGHCTGAEGVKLGSETYDMSRGATLPFPLAECKRQRVTFMANGHWHRQQVTESGIHIPGTLERLRFDEQDNSPGVMIVEVG